MPSQTLGSSDSQPPLWQAQGMQCSKLQCLKTVSRWFLTLLEGVSCSSETPGSAAELKRPEAVSGTVTRVLHSHSCFCWVIRGSEPREGGACRGPWRQQVGGVRWLSVLSLFLYMCVLLEGICLYHMCAGVQGRTGCQSPWNWRNSACTPIQGTEPQASTRAVMALNHLAPSKVDATIKLIAFIQ